MENMILQPIVVGGQTFKNRIMFPPLTTGYEKNGMISEQDMGFYTRLAKGGVGYIVLGDVAPINSFSPTPKLFDDSQIPAFKELADSVHAYGTKLGVQLFHPEYDVDAINSLFMQKKFDEMRQRLHHDMMFFTDEVSEEMLMAIIDKMCTCAVRAQKAGVDVIQIHGDRLNGCLCSTRMNHRTDKFGGSLENRVRFARMLTRAIRKAVPDMIIDYKLSIVTPQRGKGGIDEADAVQFAQWLVEDGVDMFHVAQANHTGNMADTIPPMGVQPTVSLSGSPGTSKRLSTCRSAPWVVSWMPRWQSVSSKAAWLIWWLLAVRCWQTLIGAQRSLPVRPAIFAAASAATRAAPMPSRTASSCPACSMPKMAMRTAAASSLPHRKRRWLFWAAALPVWKLLVWQLCAVTM